MLLKNDGPIPNETLQEQLSTVLAESSNGGNDCISGVNNQDITTLRKSKSELESAQTELTNINTQLGSGND
jgi:hypothetical protein